MILKQTEPCPRDETGPITWCLALSSGTKKMPVYRRHPDLEHTP